MEQAGIDLTILSVPAPHIYNGDDEKSCLVTRKINESMTNICQKHPDKFKFVACVPLPYVDGAIDELKYAMRHLGDVGVKLSTNNGVYLGDEKFEPFMKVLNDLHALVIIHPSRAKEYPKDVVTGRVAAAMFEYPTDTTRAVLNMISNRTMTKYPNIRFIVPHTGSFLPYMLQRYEGIMDILTSLGMTKKVDVKSEFEKLYFDIAGDPEPVGLNMLRMVVKDDKIIYGSDFPYSPAKVVLAKKQHLDNNEKIRI